MIINEKKKIGFIIPVAGAGSRANVTLPKCLYEVENESLIARLLGKINQVCEMQGKDAIVTVVCSPSNLDMFRSHMESKNFDRIDIHFAIQEVQDGTLSAVQSGVRYISELYVHPAEVLGSLGVIWGDCIGIRPIAIASAVELCETVKSIVVPGFFASKCYTYFEVQHGLVQKCYETKGMGSILEGFTDVGVFLMPIEDELLDDLTNAHSFDVVQKEYSYIQFLNDWAQTHPVMAMNNCLKIDKLAFNSLSDLDLR